MVSSIAELSMQLHELELLEDEVLRGPDQAKEAQYIEAWVETLCAILCYLAQGDEEEVKRLTSARDWFLDSMKGWRTKPGTRILHWQRGLAARLAYVLPPELADKVPISVWDPWVKEVG